MFNSEFLTSEDSKHFKFLKFGFVSQFENAFQEFVQEIGLMLPQVLVVQNGNRIYFFG